MLMRSLKSFQRRVCDIGVLASVLVVLTLGSKSRAEFILSSDFSTLQNPNGTWIYGSKGSIFSTFTQSGQLSIAGGQMAGWGHPSIFPFVLKNITGGTVIDGSTIYQPNAVALHPSNSGAYAVVRWTAPATGHFNVMAQFSDILNDGPATVDLHILLNNTPIYTSSLNAGNLVANFGDSVLLDTGDVLDFQVGSGGNGFSFDHTQLEVNVSIIPSPSSCLLLSAVMAVAPLRRRR